MSQACRPHQVEGARFPLPPYLKPCEKAGGPFWIWAIDVIVRVRPVGPGGISHIIVAVCVFTKWVEIGAIASVDAATVRKWFHGNIVCRYGVPGMVRTDGGAEFKGEFHSYLREVGVR